MSDWQILKTSFAGLEQIGRLYAELDRRVAAWRTAVGLSCPPFCKHCCDIPGARISVSLLEALPLCIYWWQNGQAQSWFDQLSQVDVNQDRCLLFQADNPSAWGCRYYRWRPLLCRMFCFAAALDKQGRPHITLCPPLQSQFPEWPRRLAARLPANFPFPVYREFTERVAGINPSLARTYPINQAFLEGLQVTGLRLQLGAEFVQYKKTS
jgi:Fe-S-cluster containining protein